MYFPSVTEPETFVDIPPSVAFDGKRNTSTGSTADGELHGTAGFNPEEINEIAGLIKRGKRVRLKASSLRSASGINSNGSLVDATSWKRGTILFDPTPTEVRTRKMAIMAVCSSVALALLLVKFRFKVSISRT